MAIVDTESGPGQLFVESGDHASSAPLSAEQITFIDQLIDELVDEGHETRAEAALWAVERLRQQWALWAVERLRQQRLADGQADGP